MTTTPPEDPGGHGRGGQQNDPMEDTNARPAVGGLFLRYAALSDVGRVRKDNQDAGYAGPHLLTVCDGVGGAARGDIASSTAVSQLRRLDEPPGEDLLGAVAGAIHRAHDRIAELVDEDPALNGTSTTVTVALFDGARLAIGHVGDSRAYLFRDETISQLTKDHTFVQSLIDEGRITEEESRTHPHRNLILKALDGVHESEPDLFTVDLAPGDRVLLCSDGASGSLDDTRLADILGTGTPDYAAVELVRASLEAGSSDNVTCVVADVVDTDPGQDPSVDLTPLLVGAAADLSRRKGLFRGHRSGDTGEIEPVPGAGSEQTPPLPPGVDHAVATDPIDPEEARYAPRPPHRFLWLERLLALVVVLGLLWIGAMAAYSWSQNQFYVADEDGAVTIYRGVDASILGWDLAKPYERSDVLLEELSDYDAGQVRQGIEASTLDAARHTVQNYALRRQSGTQPDQQTPEGSASPSPGQSPSPSPGQSPSPSPGQSPTGSPAPSPGPSEQSQAAAR